jgi:malonyl-CoA O-methyltransferase
MFIDRIFHRITNRVPTLSPHSAYQVWAQTYDQREDNAFLQAEERAFVPLLQSLSLNGKAVIDFGCGTGRHLSRCCGRGARSLVGVDFSREMLSRAAEKFPASERVTFLESPVESLPFRDSQFDVGISALVLSHCPDLSAPIAEMARVLKPESSLLVSDWHPENDRRGWKRIFEQPSAKGSSIRYAAKSHSHPLPEYLREFQNHGFVLDEVAEPVIDSSLEPIFRRKNMMHVFDQYAGTPLVIVFFLRMA